MNFSSSMQTISWFQDRYIEESLIIKPPYQRKPVWAGRQKCYLIESILMGLPVPEIYIQQTTSPDGKTTYAIVDGQQRIRTVLQFIGAETEPEEEDYNKFVLDKLEAGSHWRNVTFSELSNEKKKEFYGYQFAVRYLNTDLEDDVRDMFRRLNKFLTPLKPQELRNAMFSGPFVDLVENLADNEYWVENRIVTPAAIRRMGDVEFASELLIGVMHGPQGGSAKIIDDYYRQYEDYEYEFPGQRAARRLFNETLSIIIRILPNLKDTRWGNKTDFYTLFVATASLLRSKVLPANKITEVRKKLKEFAEEINTRLADEEASVTRNVIDYVRAVEKGANEKKRRADRNKALLHVIDPYFNSAKKH